MSRVARRRKNSQDRKEEILRVIVEQTITHGGTATLTSIAKRMGLTPSTYLLNVLKGMAIAGSIKFTLVRNSHNQTVYHWEIVPVIKPFCTLPWTCEDYCLMASTLQICVGH